MYAYVFDSFVQDQKYRSESNRIETRLSTLGIQGRSEKITILKNIQDSAKSLIKRGADTIVVIGNDQTIIKVLPLILESEVTLGIIPVGPSQHIAEALGLPGGTDGCDMLSRRIIRRIDVGMAGPSAFLLRADIPSGCKVQCDGAYTVEALEPDTTMSVINLYNQQAFGQPDDGRIELVVNQPNRGWLGKSSGDRSVFPIRQAKIERGRSDGKLVLDGQIMISPPTTISVQRKKLHAIVGRNRVFE